MSITFDEIYDRNQCLNAITKIEIKRKDIGGTYEATWQDIETLVPFPIVTNDVIQTIKNSIPNDDYQFGAVEVPSLQMKFNNVYGNFSKESDTRSIFYGYVRHETLIRILFTYQDSLSGDTDYQEVFRGFLNEKAAATKTDPDNIMHTFQVDDLLTYLLDKYTIADISPTETDLSDIVWEVFNRSEFTDFMTVDVGNINAGYEVTDILYTDPLTSEDTWGGNTKILNWLAELSVGHSFFYQKAGVFYYQPLAPTAAVIKEFDQNKIVKFSNYERGINKIYEVVYWTDTNTKWTAPTNKYNKTLSIAIKGLYYYAQRMALLTAVGQRYSTEYDAFVLEIPLYPKVFIGDKLQVSAGSYDQADAFILDKSRLDIDYLRDRLGSSQIDLSSYWMVTTVDNNWSSMVTKISVQSFI
jgi:hypothetical protein